MQAQYGAVLAADRIKKRFERELARRREEERKKKEEEERKRKQEQQQ